MTTRKSSEVRSLFVGTDCSIRTLEVLKEPRKKKKCLITAARKEGFP